MRCVGENYLLNCFENDILIPLRTAKAHEYFADFMESSSLLVRIYKINILYEYEKEKQRSGVNGFPVCQKVADALLFSW